MIEKYLKELIQSKNRVIIPKIGAFILRNNKITFNSILKFDDGVFSGYVAQKEGTDKGSAAKKIQELSERILKTIDSGEKFPIEGVGNIYKDANGKVQFIEGAADSAQEPDDKKSSSTKKSTATPKKETPKDKKEATPPKKESTTKKEEQQKASSTEDKKTTPPKEEPPKTEKKTTTPPPKTAQAGEKKEPVKKPEPTSSATTATTSSKKSGNKTFLWVSIIVLLIAGGVTAFLLLYEKDTVKEDPLFTEQELKADSTLQEEEEKLAQAEKELGVAEDKTSEEKIEGKKTDKKEKEKTVQEKKQKSKDVSKSSGPKFYVIAGCFQVEKNADKYAQKLRKKGFQDAEKFGKHKNMHAVCYTSHNNMQDALQSLKEIRASQEPNAWLLKQ